MNQTQQPVPIFIVENANIFERMLDYIFSKDIVFKFHEFKNEAACLENLHLKPEYIVLDHSLSGVMNGSDTIREIKRQQPESKILILLAKEDEKLAAKLLNAGANDYLIKNENLIKNIEIKLDEHLSAKKVKKPFFVRDSKPSLKVLGYFFLLLALLSLGVYYYK
jgi:DNA-binding NarL/FixJ family response regulator